MCQYEKEEIPRVVERRSKDSGERSSWVSRRTKKALNVLRGCFGCAERPSCEEEKVGQSSVNVEVSLRHDRQTLTENHASNRKKMLGALFSKEDLGELNVQAQVSSDKFGTGLHRDDASHQSPAAPRDLRHYLEQRVKILTEAKQCAEQIHNSKKKIEEAIASTPEYLKNRVEKIMEHYSTASEESLKKIRNMFDEASVYEKALENLKEASDKLKLLGDASNQLNGLVDRMERDLTDVVS
jgi:molecular chaperone DnaK (HSP70)